ncbi:MAG: Gfo/Idh/MocA family oxidoreductase [Candidatus Bathyarchaeota archaeon]|jgi:UDP-N-acetylglucosamine 3-dehydrogenase
MKKLGVAVIGAGFWGRNHARNFRELDETELLAICDTNPERAKTAAEQFQIEAYTDNRKLLKRRDIEAVTICTWSTKLASEALRALKAGKHVLVEKPMAHNVRQARKLLDLAQEKERLLTVGFLMRFIPGIQHIKEAINKREIGTLVCATAKRVSRWPERIGDVGVVKDIAIHDIDIVRYLFNQDPTAVYAKTGALKHKFEDYAQIMLAFDEGKTAFIEANWLTPYKIRKLVVTGSEAIMNLDYLTQEVTVETARQTLTPRYKQIEPLKLELQHFSNCIMNDKEPMITGIDGLKALQIAQRALVSAEKCTTVKLK